MHRHRQSDARMHAYTHTHTPTHTHTNTYLNEPDGTVISQGPGENPYTCLMASYVVLPAHTVTHTHTRVTLAWLSHAGRPMHAGSADVTN